jgi:hypothetical protein
MDTVLPPSQPAGTAPNMEEAQTSAEGHGEEARHDRPCAPRHHGGTSGGANTIASGRDGKGTAGT